MNKLGREKRCQIVASLVEGNSIRATCRMTDTAKGTVLKLLRDIGAVCAEYQDEHLHGLSCRTLEVDEIWSFVYAKQKNLRDEYKRTPGFGDVWTFTAICADTKLIPTWRVGSRDVGTATDFMQDLAARLANRAQITTDGHVMYLSAIEDAFGANVDYAMLQKIYGESPEPQKRYSPAKCIGIKVEAIQGNPDPKRISTSYVERQNLTMRMSMRRFTRLTNAFSKKVENLVHAVALHFMYYNFCRIHQSLRITPAMAAGVTDKLWGVEDIVRLLEAREK